MATQTDLLLRDLITSIKQQSEFGPDMTERQVVTIHFTTPHGFSGSVKMPLADWSNPETRERKVIQAVIDLEGPFWEHGEEVEESEL
jgi:hypothetical protein